MEGKPLKIINLNSTIGHEFLGALKTAEGKISQRQMTIIA